MSELELKLTSELRALLTVADAMDQRLVAQGIGYCNQQGTWHDFTSCELCSARSTIAQVDGLIAKGD